MSSCFLPLSAMMIGYRVDWEASAFRVVTKSVTIPVVPLTRERKMFWNRQEVEEGVSRWVKGGGKHATG